MAWFCKRCDDFMLFNSDYCDDCLSIRRREQKAQRKAKEAKNEKIREEIRQYKETQQEEIKNKYKVLIEYISEDSIHNNMGGIAAVIAMGSIGGNIFNIKKEDKVKIISKDETLQNRISDLKHESKELKEALEELEDIKNETFK